MVEDWAKAVKEEEGDKTLVESRERSLPEDTGGRSALLLHFSAFAWKLQTLLLVDCTISKKLPAAEHQM